MNIERIHVKNFLSHSDSVVEFTGSDLWLVAGENGTGKTALLDAVEYGLYGQHRGKHHNDTLLVKHGADRAWVELTIRLGTDRLRVQRVIDAEKGNLAGQIHRWSEQAQSWQPINCGSGVLAAWNWLGGRLPSHNLFRSGIFLRQGETGHFLSGVTSDRVKRFAELIDLGQYTKASERSKKRAAAAEKRRDTAIIRLLELGDLSDAALEAARETLRTSETKVREATARRREVQDIARGAANWNRVTTRQNELVVSRNQQLALLDDGDAIRSADRRVREWDVAAPQLDRYWRTVDLATRLHEEAAAATNQARDLDAKYARAQSDHADAEQRRVRIQDELPPALRVKETTSERVVDLQREQRIAEVRTRLENAKAQAGRFQGKAAELANWETCSRALPLLESLARARSELAEARREGIRLTGEQETVGREAERARSSLKAAENTELELQQQRQSTLEEMNEAAVAAARLTGQVASHQQLTGEESECPVCAQALDEGARDHVRQVLADKTVQLAMLETSVEQLQDKERGLAGTLKEWTERRQAADRESRELAKSLS